MLLASVPPDGAGDDRGGRLRSAPRHGAADATACFLHLSLGEGFNVRDGADIRDRAADLEIMAELGAQRVNAASLDPSMRGNPGL